jgi:hypothetical protein
LRFEAGRVGHAETIMYRDYPIEQLARSTSTRFQMGFARLTMHLLPEFEEVALEPSSEGLKILAASEAALAPPGELIRRIHAQHVEFNHPQVRFLHEGSLREPIMWVRAAVDRVRTEAVIQDLVRRGADIDEVDWMAESPIVRARAPLRQLLGYQQSLAALAGKTAELRIWLSHWEPIPPGPGEAA